MSEDKEKFLSRWSRLKQDAKEQEAQQPAHPPDASNAPPPDLPPVEKLTFESDFRGFFHPKVDEKLRRAALKKLFSDPHFNVMDGLDVYIDDYSKPSPLPAAMLAQLRQAQKILDWAKEIKEEKEEHPAEPPTGVALLGTLDSSPPAPAVAPSEERVRTESDADETQPGNQKA